MVYELYYWPTIPGRGEFVRLALEAAGAEYVDVARAPENEGGGRPAVQAVLGDTSVATPPFAPPVLKAGKLVIAQTPNILLYLGDKHRLAPKTEAGRLWTNQLQMTMADFLVEAHDVHHPLAKELYYEEQKDEALRRSESFIRLRIPKFLDYFERVLSANASGHLVGKRLSYVDLSLFHMVAGLRYAFPLAMRREEKKRARLGALHDMVAENRRIASYLASERRLDFNDHGIFRHYPELDR